MSEPNRPAETPDRHPTPAVTPAFTPDPVTTAPSNLGLKMTVLVGALLAVGLLAGVFFGNDIKRSMWTSSQSLRSGNNSKVAYDATIEGDSHGYSRAEHTTEDLDAGGAPSGGRSYEPASAPQRSSYRPKAQLQPRKPRPGPVAPPVSKRPDPAPADPGKHTVRPPRTTPKPDPKPQADRNAYYGSQQLTGSGQMARIRKLIASGVKVGGKTVALSGFVTSYRQDLPAPKDGSVGLSITLDHALQPQAGGTAYLQVALKGTPTTPEKRLPLNVHLVLDRSGSMRAGGKMTQAKLAAKEVVRLLEPHDTFSLITYSTGVQILAAAGKVTDKQSLYRKIDEIRAGGSTNIYGGLQAGYAQEQRFHSDEHLNLVLLLSDGKATAGPTTTSAISRLATKAFDQGVQTTAVGLGLDYNEELMIAVARQGHGSYHFIEQAEAITELFRKEFTELGRTVALALRTRVEFAADVKLYRVLGFEKLDAGQVADVKQTERKLDQRLASKYGIKSDRGKKDEAGVKFFKTTLKKNAAQIYLFEIGLPAGKDPREIAKVHFEYKDMVGFKNRKSTTAATVAYGKDEAAVSASVDRKVMKNQLGFETGYALRKAAHLIGRGQTRTAYRTIADHQALLAKVGAEWSDGDLTRDAELLKRYVDVLKPLQARNIAHTPVGTYLMKTFSYEGFKLSQ